MSTGNPPSGELLRAEFRKLSEIATRATAAIPDPRQSIRLSGIWSMRSRSGELLCEVSSDGTVLESDEGLELVLIERIADLRAAGYSSRAILTWFGIDVPSDALRDATEALSIAMRCRRCGR